MSRLLIRGNANRVVSDTLTDMLVFVLLHVRKFTPLSSTNECLTFVYVSDGVILRLHVSCEFIIYLSLRTSITGITIIAAHTAIGVFSKQILSWWITLIQVIFHWYSTYL